MASSGNLWGLCLPPLSGWSWDYLLVLLSVGFFWVAIYPFHGRRLLVYNDDYPTVLSRSCWISTRLLRWDRDLEVATSFARNGPPVDVEGRWCWFLQWLDCSFILVWKFLYELDYLICTLCPFYEKNIVGVDEREREREARVEIE